MRFLALLGIERSSSTVRPLGPEIFGRGSHRVVTVPTSPQGSGFPRAAKRGASYPVTPGSPNSNGWFTFWTQYAESSCALLTVPEVAARLRVCRATVYRMIDKGQLPALRVSSGAIRVIVDSSEGAQLPPAGPRDRRTGCS